MMTTMTTKVKDSLLLIDCILFVQHLIIAMLPISDDTPMPTSALLGPIESDPEDAAEDFEPVDDELGSEDEIEDEGNFVVVAFSFFLLLLVEHCLTQFCVLLQQMTRTNWRHQPKSKRQKIQ